jgi:DNA-binding NtrC family response regulator
MHLHKLLWYSHTTATSAELNWCQSVPNLAVVRVDSAAAAVEAVSKGEFNCVLATADMADTSRVEVLEMIHAIDPSLAVVFWNPELSAAQGVRLFRAGAYFCFGHQDSEETVRDCVESAMEERRGRENAAGSEPWRSFLVGDSRAMETVIETIRLIGNRRCTVLIGGETGTGKEIAARALHAAGSRANQPFVAINCSALPENLLEAELFGHVKGAFTGAINARVGRFEQAHKGTLFLDEIGDMPFELQTKLLRVLQDREIQRLGGSENIKVDVRVIAATNANLLERVQQGRFREDLYYRLNVVPLQMPPLRKRTSDIGLLVTHFVKRICQMEGIAVKTVTPEAVERLQSCPWPGNVRQLENSVEMAIAMSGERNTLYASDFGLGPVLPAQAPSADCIPFPVPEAMDFETAVSNFERAMLERALKTTAGNKTAAAELLGLKRTTLIMKLRNYSGPAQLCAVR